MEIIGLVDHFLARHAVRLTPSENLEVLRLAEGLSCAASAKRSRVGMETVRARRKHLYKKLGVKTAGELTAGLLQIALNLIPSERPMLASVRDMAPMELQG